METTHPTGMPCRCLIVDDEQNARLHLHKLLKPFAGEVTVVGEASDGEEALRKIEELSPDVVFLDIQMPRMNAFEVIEMIKDPLPRIIFTTAHDTYAVKAFDVDSIDYLLKPINPERLGRAVEKAVRAIRETTVLRKSGLSELSAITQILQELQKKKLQRIQVRIGDAITFINISDISYFSGEDYLTAVFTADNKKHLIETPLYTLETRLPAADFVRIHRGTILNVSYIKEITRAGGGKLKAELSKPAHTALIISRSYAKKIRELFHCL